MRDDPGADRGVEVKGGSDRREPRGKARSSHVQTGAIFFIGKLPVVFRLLPSLNPALVTCNSQFRGSFFRRTPFPPRRQLAAPAGRSRRAAFRRGFAGDDRARRLRRAVISIISYRFDKPPLTYWCQVASYRVFGQNNFAARFPSAVAAALTALVIFAWGRRLNLARAGWWGAIFFTLCLQTFMMAKAATADMWLVLFRHARLLGGLRVAARSLRRDLAQRSVSA